MRNLVLELHDPETTLNLYSTDNESKVGLLNNNQKFMIGISNFKKFWIISSLTAFVTVISLTPFSVAWDRTMKKATIRRKGVSYNRSTGEIVDCLFCRIQRGEEPARVVFEDSDVVVFKTIKPYTHTHLLAIPRTHIQNARSLRGSDGAQVVRQLVAAGEHALGPKYAPDALYCFHMPPINSIDHLHLHVIASPSSLSMRGAIKYNTWMYHCQSAARTIELLEKDATT